MALPTYSVTKELQLKMASSAQLSSELQLKVVETTLEHNSFCHHMLSTNLICLACASRLLLNTSVLSKYVLCIAAWKIAGIQS